MEKNKTFNFPEKFRPLLQTLNGDDYKKLMESLMDKNSDNLDGITKTYYDVIIVDINNIDNQKEIGRKYGKLGGRPKKNKEVSEEKTQGLENENQGVLEEKPKEKKSKEKEIKENNNKVNENNNSPPQKFEEEKIKKIDNNSNLKNEYIMKMRDAETRGKFMIKKWNEKRPDKKQFTMSDDLKKLIASFLDIGSIEEFETAIENFVFVLNTPYYKKRQSKYNLEHWDFQKFLENIGMFQDVKEAYQKVIGSIGYRQTFRKKEEEELPEFKDRKEEMEYYEKKKKKEKEEYKGFTSQYGNPLKQI